MPKNYRVTQSFNNPEQNRCVDIIELNAGGFRFQEWRREPEDISGWFLMTDSGSEIFPSEEQAINAARLAVVWFNELADQ